MTADGQVEEGLAYEALSVHDDQQATVHALLAIRAELHLANLIALAAAQSVPLIAQGWGDSGYTLPPEAKRLRETIRQQLDDDLGGEATS